MTPTARSIIIEVAEKHCVPVADILGESRQRRFAYPRHEAMWRCRKETRLSLPQIGRQFRRDHSTVLHGVRAHEARMGEGA